MAIVYDSTRYANKPALLPVCTTLAQHIVTDTAAPNQVSAAGLQRIKDAAGIVAVDIETWKDPALYTRAMMDIRKVRSGDVGLYMRPPIRDYWAPNQTTLTGLHDFRVWKAMNTENAQIAPYVDIVFPSLYTFYNDLKGWERYAVANICEARRVAPGKKILPFLWPQYHDSNATLKGTFIDKAFFKHQLFVCCAYADGAVVWDWQPSLTWADTFPWWQAYTEFKAAGGLEL
jgi:hypothetical protein